MHDERSTKRPRRIKVAGKPNIYYREVATPGRAKPKRVYEVGYRDHEGRQRWRIVHGDLRRAEATRDELIGRRRRGERIPSARTTFGEVAAAWFDAQTSIRPSTRSRYEVAMRVHVLPRLANRPIAKITEDDVSDLIRDLLNGRDPDGRARRALTPWGIRAVLTPLSRVFSFAIRRGFVTSNPVRGLERGERPSVGKRELRILNSEEVELLLDACDETTRVFVAVSAFTGARLSEVLGLRWEDVDLDGESIRIRRQLARDGHLVEPKTDAAKREVVVMPSLTRMLREHRLRSPFSADTDFVFSTARRTPLDQSNVRRSFGRAVERTGLDRLRLHDLRHVAASAWIAAGVDPVTVSRQLGHADPAITLRVYAGEFDRARHADAIRAALEDAYGGVIQGSARRASREAEPSGGMTRAEFDSISVKSAAFGEYLGQDNSRPG
jgi:integrase